MDVARLGFAIDSRDAVSAERNLDRLADTATRTDREAKGMGRAFDIAANDARGLGRQIDYAGDQARRAEREFNRMERGTGLVTRGLGLAAAAGAAFIASLSVAEMLRIADGFTLLEGRISLFTDSTSETNAVMSSLDTTAFELGTSVQSLGDIYARLAPAQEQLGYSSAQLLTITDAIATSMVVSGASATEAEAAIVQLAQGLAAGALRGDEFNSVAEQAPRLMRVLADYLGVNTGELREMAAQGRLTADVVGNALLGAASELRGELDQLPETIDRASTALKGELSLALRDFNNELGITRGLASAIRATAQQARGIRVGLEFSGLDEAGIRAEIERMDQLIGALESTEDGPFRARSRARAQAQEILGTQAIRELADAGALSGENYVEGLVGALQARQEAARAAINALVAPTGGGGRLNQLSAAQLAVDGLVSSLDREFTTLTFSRREREMRVALLAAEKAIQDDSIPGWERLTDLQQDDLRTALQRNALRQDEVREYDNINSAVEDYRTQIAALNSLMSVGAITAGEYWGAVLDGRLVQGAQDLDSFLRSMGANIGLNNVQAANDNAGNPFAGMMESPGLAGGGDEIIRLQEQYAQRQALLDQLREADLISYEGYQQRLTALQEAATAERLEMERSAYAMQMGAASSAFESIADIMAGFAGEQSGIYRAMFAVSKAFAIAEASINMYGAIMKALNTPFPANIPLMANAAASGAAIMSNIQAASAGFMAGGYTGNGPVNQIAGVVHGQEGVLNAGAMRGIGRENLDYMNRTGQVPSNDNGGAVTVNIGTINAGSDVSREEVYAAVREGAEQAVVQSTRISAKDTNAKIERLARPQISARGY